MQKILLVVLLTGAVVGAAASKAASDEWEMLLNWDIARVDLNVSSIEKGPNKGIQAYVVTMHSAPKMTPDGAEYKNATQVHKAFRAPSKKQNILGLLIQAKVTT